MNTTIRLAGVVNDSILDGKGIRYAIFTQGCTHGCPGCHNQNTHDLLGGYLENIDNIIIKIKKNPMLDGITLTGGDPMLQVKECLDLVNEIKKEIPELNIWCYTGYTYEECLSDPVKFELTKKIDVLVDGRFVESLRSEAIGFRGSANQRVIDVQASILAGSVIELKEE